jgi:hypothetical protein
VDGSPEVPRSTPTTDIGSDPPAWLRMTLPPTAVRPPSTTSAAPVTKRASSLAR